MLLLPSRRQPRPPLEHALQQPTARHRDAGLSGAEKRPRRQPRSRQRRVSSPGEGAVRLRRGDPSAAEGLAAGFSDVIADDASVPKHVSLASAVPEAVFAVSGGSDADPER